MSAFMQEFTLLLERETPLARSFFEVDRNNLPVGERIWIPRSLTKHVIKFNEEYAGCQLCRVTIPEWLAEEKNLL